MELNPQQSLERLKGCGTAFVHAKGVRTKESRSFQTLINRAEIELSNLSHHMGDDSDQRQRRLFGRWRRR